MGLKESDPRSPSPNLTLCTLLNQQSMAESPEPSRLVKTTIMISMGLKETDPRSRSPNLTLCTLLNQQSMAESPESSRVVKTTIMKSMGLKETDRGLVPRTSRYAHF